MACDSSSGGCFKDPDAVIDVMFDEAWCSPCNRWSTGCCPCSVYATPGLETTEAVIPCGNEFVEEGEGECYAADGTTACDNARGLTEDDVSWCDPIVNLSHHMAVDPLACDRIGGHEDACNCASWSTGDLVICHCEDLACTSCVAWSVVKSEPCTDDVVRLVTPDSVLSTVDSVFVCSPDESSKSPTGGYVPESTCRSEVSGSPYESPFGIVYVS